MDELEEFKQTIQKKINDLRKSKSSIVIEGEELQYESILLGYYQILASLVPRP